MNRDPPTGRQFIDPPWVVAWREMEAEAMPRGRGWLFARQSNAPELSRGLLVDFRATLIRAGGETRNAGEDE